MTHFEGIKPKSYVVNFPKCLYSAGLNRRCLMALPMKRGDRTRTMGRTSSLTERPLPSSPRDWAGELPDELHL